MSIVQSRLGNSAPTACSALTGSVWAVQPKRRASRPKCVSTVMPGMPKALPRTTLAVLRPTPGRVDEVVEPGRNLAAVALDERGTELEQGSVLARKKPSGPMICSRLLAVGAGHRRGVGVGREQRRADGVDPLVGGLGAEHGDHEQLEGIVEVELAPGVGVGLARTRSMRRARRTEAPSRVSAAGRADGPLATAGHAAAYGRPPDGVRPGPAWCL